MAYEVVSQGKNVGLDLELHNFSEEMVYSYNVALMVQRKYGRDAEIKELK